MKIEFEINEEKIKELAQANSMEDLPRAIFYEARSQAIKQVVDQIKADSLIKDTYYSGKEELNNKVAEAVMSKISELIKELIEKRLTEKHIQESINRHFDRVFREWVETKIYARLEEAKKDIFIGSYGELRTEQEEIEKAHQEEINRMSERS